MNWEGYLITAPFGVSERKWNGFVAAFAVGVPLMPLEVSLTKLLVAACGGRMQGCLWI